MTAETGSIKVLIADDDSISRKLLEKLLNDQSEGMEVFVARDGQEAWEIAQRERTPLVIADWMMPRMDGLQLCRKLRNADFDRYVYVILLTARDDQNDVLEGLDAGADDYVRKPFNQHELRLRVKAGKRIVRLEEELASKNDQLQVLNAKLEEMARVDTLMQIGNRNSFYERIGQVHDQAMRYGKRYGLLVCDVDHFKQVNDMLGHQAGDKVLRDMARAIKSGIRVADDAFRYGGEEIVVLLPEQDVHDAARCGERICQAVRDMGIAHPKDGNSIVTISVGAAAYDPGCGSAGWEDVLEKADMALYQAKADGRNRVCVHGLADRQYRSKAVSR